MCAIHSLIKNIWRLESGVSIMETVGLEEEKTHFPEADGDHCISSSGVCGGHAVLKPGERDLAQQSHTQDSTCSSVHGEGVRGHSGHATSSPSSFEQYSCEQDSAYITILMQTRASTRHDYCDGDTRAILDVDASYHATDPAMHIFVQARIVPDSQRERLSNYIRMAQQV